mgnify:CR=1 FL=1|tara:strand:+ start:256 stop:579 length:324 start_codon:yes stop_codon:yes gene_type:complete
MKYTVNHGSIASVQYITKSNGKKFTITDSKDDHSLLAKFPIEVQDFVNSQFEYIFSLPYALRESFIQNSIPFEIDIDESCLCGCTTPRQNWETNYSGYLECPNCRMV